MQSSSKLHDEKYRNWVRGALGLTYLQEGLQTFTDDVIQDEQTRILQKAGRCTSCTTEDILPAHAIGKICIQKCRLKCNCRIKKTKKCHCCSTIYDEIILQHRYRDPAWETDATKWCTDHWQIAKCFMVTTSKGSNNTAFETDAAGLLSIIINGLFFQTVLQSTIDPPNDIFSKTKAARNEILHNTRQQLTDCEVTNYIQLMIDVLQDNVKLLNDEAAKSAVKKLKAIHSDKLTISAEVETKAIEAALAVIKLTKEETKECIKAAADENQKMMEEQKVKALEDIKTAQEHAVGHVQRDFSLKFDEEYKPDLKKLKQVKDDHENRLQAIETEIRDKTNILNTAEQQHKRRLTYLQQKNELKEDLILFNKQHHGTIPFSLVEDDAPLEELYVFPEMNCIEIQKSVSSHRHEMRSRITTLKDVFCKTSSNIRLKEIYVLSEAGMGKSAFAKLLAATWCYSQKPEKGKGALFEQVNVQCMYEFEFLFLLSLRDFRDSISDVDHMIMHQVISNLSRSSRYTIENLQEILHQETSLIILDGLDEWSTTDTDIQIPRRKAREYCSILTTTRTCKFSTLTLNTTEIDRKCEIVGLDKVASERLARNVMSKLNDDYSSQSVDFQEFFHKIELMNIKELIRIPMIMLYLVCLRHDNRAFGNTRCDVYSCMVEFLLSHANEKRRDIVLQTRFEDKNYSPSKLPQCHERNEYCRKYSGLLEKLAVLAFHTLFRENQELSVVFESSEAEKTLSKSGLDFSLAVGLLSKSKIPGRLTKRVFKSFFPHKTFQEYFAAFHIHFNREAISVLLRECKSVDTVLSMGNVLIFLSGLCPEAISKLSEGIIDIISMDSVTQSYRCDALSFKNITKYHNVIKSLLNIHVCCIQENSVSKQNKVHLHFEDFIIDDADDQDNSAYALKDLMKMNITRIKSLNIINMKNCKALSEIIDTFSLNEISTLQRLDYWGPMAKETIYLLLFRSTNTLKSLTIHGVDIQLPFKVIAKYISLSMESLDTLKVMPKLETISLWCIKLNHSQLGELLKCLSRKQNMKYIGLQEVLCSDHMDICDGFSFDLSKHERLEVMNIGQIPLSKIEINTHAIEECRIVPFPNRKIVSEILQCLPEAEKLETFVCHYMTDDHDIENVLNTIPNLRQLKRIRFLEIDFGQRDKILPVNMASFEFLCLLGVTMSSQALKTIVNVIESYKQLVEIQLQYCNIIPSEEYEQVKEDIRKSNIFEVVLDGSNSRGAYEFTFKKRQSDCECVIYSRTSNFRNVK